MSPIFVFGYLEFLRNDDQYCRGKRRPLSIGAAELLVEQPAAPKSKFRWYYQVPCRILIVLLAVKGTLLLSETLFPKDWAFLFAIVGVVVAMGFILIWLVHAKPIQKLLRFYPKFLRFHPMPGHLLIVLLVVEGILLLSGRFRWFAFNDKNGWKVLIAIASVAVTIILMLLWFIVALLFRWRFQFSIRSLLVFTVAVALPFSWLAVEMQQAKKQQTIKEEIWKLGGSWSEDDYMSTSTERLEIRLGLCDLLGNSFFVNTIRVGSNGSQNIDSVLKHLKDLNPFIELYIDSSHVTDTGLEEIKNITHLKVLSMSNTDIIDSQLEHLDGMHMLEELTLSYTQISDAGLVHIKRLPNLKDLDLSGTQISDTGLEHLRGLKQLNMLFIGSTKITDTGLKYIAELDQLNCILLSDTQVTDAGVEKLKTALPNLEILLYRK